MLTKRKIRKPNPRRRFNPKSTPLDEFHELIKSHSSKNDQFVFDAIEDCILQYAENRESDIEFTKNGILRKLERIEGIVNLIHKDFSKANNK